jgi:hypothetical protein
MKRHGRRGSVKFAVKSENTEEMISRLESSKSNLVLAYMLYREAAAEKRATDMQQQMQSLAASQAMLLAQAPCVKTLPKTPRNPLGSRPAARFEKIARLRTPLWMSQTVWEIVVSRAISGWTVSLRSRRLVSRDSPVAQACLGGDASLLRQLFDRREASPFDEIQTAYGDSFHNLLSVRSVDHVLLELLLT